MSETPDIWREIGPALAEAVAEAYTPTVASFFGSACGDCADRDATIADLRAVLAPLLDDPIRHEWDTFDGVDVCLLCGADNTIMPKPGSWRETLRMPECSGPVQHAPDCPVLRRDELLGR